MNRDHITTFFFTFTPYQLTVHVRAISFFYFQFSPCSFSSSDTGGFPISATSESFVNHGTIVGGVGAAGALLNGLSQTGAGSGAFSGCGADGSGSGTAIPINGIGRRLNG